MTLILASSFNDIISITAFGAASALAFKDMKISDVSPLFALKKIGLEILYGLVAGFIAGMAMKAISDVAMLPKAIVLLTVSFTFLVVC